MFKKAFPARSYHEELLQQRERLGIEDPDETVTLAQAAVQPKVRGPSFPIELRICNLGRDFKIPEALPKILEGVVGPADWREFAADTNDMLKKYRARRMDNYLMALVPVLPPVYPVLIGRERKLRRKKLAVLEASIQAYNEHHRENVPPFALYIDHEQAERDLASALRVRIQGGPTAAGHPWQPSAPVGTMHGEHDGDALGKVTTPKGPAESLMKLLQAIGLQEHGTALATQGFEEIEHVKLATMEDLVACGMKRGHARRLLDSLSKPQGSDRTLVNV